MKKFFLIVLYTLKHLFKMLFIIGVSWLIAAGIIWFLEACELNVLSIQRALFNLKYASARYCLASFLISFL